MKHGFTRSCRRRTAARKLFNSARRASALTDESSAIVLLSRGRPVPRVPGATPTRFHRFLARGSSHCPCVPTTPVLHTPGAPSSRSHNLDHITGRRVGQGNLACNYPFRSVKDRAQPASRIGFINSHLSLARSLTAWTSRFRRERPFLYYRLPDGLQEFVRLNSLSLTKDGGGGQPLGYKLGFIK